MTQTVSACQCILCVCDIIFVFVFLSLRVLACDSGIRRLSFSRLCLFKSGRQAGKMRRDETYGEWKGEGGHFMTISNKNGEFG